VADRRLLQEKTIFGSEPKPLPYLLCQMNLLLHGLDAPQIDPGNALRHKLTDIGERDRVDVILTNPPFGGKEGKEAQAKFPYKTSATTVLFLQHVIDSLKRAGGAGSSSTRACCSGPTRPRSCRPSASCSTSATSSAS